MNRVKELRKAKNITQDKLARMLHINQTSVSQWETGRTSPDPEIAREMAKIFGVSMEYLLGYSDKQISGNWVPVFGRVVAGIPIEAITDIVDYEEITEEMARNGQHIAIRVSGSSMEPKISDGDVVIVRIQPDVENGEIAVVMVNGDDATCKKIKKAPEGLYLLPTNPAFPTLFFTPREVQETPVRILGKVVELRAKF